VTGEFHRLVADCIAHAEATDASGAARWTRQLEDAAARSADSLTTAAHAALDLLEDAAQMPSFASRSERDAFASRAEHLAAICRVIVGRPAQAPAGPDRATPERDGDGGGRS
jgi:hypothetical protein